jgi:hypothetical protein
MDIQGLGYVGVRAKSLEDWTSFGTRFLGMQLDRSARAWRCGWMTASSAWW